MKISIVIPVYNEINTFLELYRQVQAVPLEKEIIIIDDFSTDGTREVLQSLKTPDVKVLFQKENQGKGAALREGFKHISGDIVIIQDADLEYYPSEYPLLIQKIIEKKADVVYGTRFLGARRVFAFHHAVGNAILNFIANLLFDANLSDYMTCFKAFRADVAKGLALRANGFEVESEITAKIFKQNLKVYEVPISYNGRTYAEGKKITWRDFFPCCYWLLKCKWETYDTGEDTLNRMRLMPNNNRWLLKQLLPYLGETILEIGSGIGNISQLLTPLQRDLILTDISPRYLDYLQERFIGHPRVRVIRHDATSTDFSQMPAGIDTIICINVLEHIEKEQQALKNMFDLLIPGGHLLLIVPAHQKLYGTLDKKLDHFRRYSKNTLSTMLQGRGFLIKEAKYHNLVGALGWYFNGKILRKKLMSCSQVRLFDRIIPLISAIESRVKVPFGLSVIAIAKKPEA